MKTFKVDPNPNVPNYRCTIHSEEDDELDILWEFEPDYDDDEGLDDDDLEKTCCGESDCNNCL